MLEDFIIEEIKKRNKKVEVDNPQPHLELEIDYPDPTRNAKLPEDDSYGTVITIDLNLDIED
jgi:hypothetical protein